MPPKSPSNVSAVQPKPRSRGPFATFMNKFGTPFTTIFFLISTVTGVALFFHWGPGAFHPMHEWLSMVLLLAFALHLIKNWIPLINYGRRGLLYIPLIIGVVACAYFFIQPSSKPAGNRQVAFGLMAMVSKTSLTHLAPLCHTDDEGIINRLKAQKITVSSPDDTVEQIAKQNGRNTNEVLLALMSGGGGAGHEHKRERP